MPINHTKKFLKSIHTVAFFWWLFSETLNFYFISVLVLIKMVINRKLLWRLISIYPRMSIVIREKCVGSTVCAAVMQWSHFKSVHRGDKEHSLSTHQVSFYDSLKLAIRSCTTISTRQIHPWFRALFTAFFFYNDERKEIALFFKLT